MLVIPADPDAPMLVTAIEESRRKQKSRKGRDEDG